MTKAQRIIPAAQRAMYDNFQFAPAVRAGDTLYISGQIGLDDQGQAIADPTEQFTAAFEGVKLILEEAGASMADIVEMTTFHVGLQDHLPTFMQVKSGYLPENFPSWTAIGITELAVPGATLEIKCIAWLGD